MLKIKTRFHNQIGCQVDDNQSEISGLINKNVYKEKSYKVSTNVKKEVDIVAEECEGEKRTLERDRLVKCEYWVNIEYPLRAKQNTLSGARKETVRQCFSSWPMQKCTHVRTLSSLVCHSGLTRQVFPLFSHFYAPLLSWSSAVAATLLLENSIRVALSVLSFF